MRRRPARLGAQVLILLGEGYCTAATAPWVGPHGERPRNLVRFLAGEFGTITAIAPDWYRRYTVTLPPHPDWPDDGERTFMFTRDEILVLPTGTVPNTSAMDNHFRGITQSIVTL